MKQRRFLNPSSNRKKTTPILAVATSVALVAAGAFGGNDILKTLDIGDDQAQVASSTASLADGASVMVDDPAVATQGDDDLSSRAVKEFTRDEEFSIFGLTWHGDRDIAAFVRAQRPDGSWSEWFPMGYEPAMDGSELNGTEPVYIEPTKKIQVSTANVDLVELNVPGREVTEQAEVPASQETPSTDAVDIPAEAESPAVLGDAEDKDPATDEATEEEKAEENTADGEADQAEEEKPSRALPTNHGDIAPVAEVQEAAASNGTSASDIEAVFIDGGEGTTDGAIAPAQYNTNGMPRVISRASWGAGGQRSPYYTEPTKAITVHHTSGSNNYTEAQSAGIVRGIWHYHAVTRGWGDVGYNALVDKYGNIYEGRAGGLDRNPQGAHVGGFNANTWGVSMMGDYQTAQPSREAMDAMGELIGWKAGTADLDPTGKVQLTSDYSFAGTKYPKGKSDTFNVVNAHRDFHYNDCPGDNLYSQMGYIRNVAKAKADAIKGGDASTDTEQKSDASDANDKTGQSTTVENGDGTNTKINNLNNLSSDVSLESILTGDASAIAAAVGTVAGSILMFAASNDLLPKQVSNVGDMEILPGMTLSSVRPQIGEIIDKSGNQAAKDAWKQVDPVLGQLDGVLQGVGGDEYAFYEKGIAALSSDGAKVIMPEKIADAWLKQGMDLGPLGKPVKSDDAADNGDVRVDFQRGKIFYDAKTGNLDVSVD